MRLRGRRDGAAAATYAAVLDGVHLWLDLDGPVSVRDADSNAVIELGEQPCDLTGLTGSTYDVLAGKAAVRLTTPPRPPPPGPRSRRTAPPAGRWSALDDGRLRLARHTVAATAELDAVDVRGDRVHLRVRPPGGVEPGCHLLLLDTDDQVLGDAARDRARRAGGDADRGRRPAGRLLRHAPARGRHGGGVGPDPAAGQRPGRPPPRRAPPGAVRAGPRTEAPRAGCGGTPTGCSRSARSTRTRPGEQGVKVTFLTQSAHKLGGTERSAITQANALVAAGHDVRILSVVKAADQPVFAIDDRVVVEHLVDLTGDVRRGAARPGVACWCRSDGTSSSPR